ncbi:hypothetical protein M9H77_16539 [Catharanthus roseus]|uniref:Uncharacterized protein n=1 Tax=Catharanthus roseus TaxID=4058 RepID=A0ACC0B217_CATRO|nr:hypothetical protein M9H77_16539 [Catharanthus roseus]
MDKMRSRSPFSLSSLLILFLYDVACSPMLEWVIRFSLLLSCILHHFHVDFSGKLQETTVDTDVINKAIIKRSHYWWDENERRWRPAVQQGDDEQAQEVEDNAAEAVEDDDFRTIVIDRLEHTQIRYTLLLLTIELLILHAGLRIAETIRWGCVVLKIVIQMTGTGIPRAYPRPWMVGSGSINFIRRGSGSRSMFHYKGLGLGVPEVLDPFTPLDNFS